MIKKIFFLVEKLINNFANNRRSGIFEKLAKAKIDKPFSLTKEQKAELQNVYRKYHPSQFHSVAFYTQKTGIFDKYYIPDGLWYGFIDTYYNPPKIAKVLDSKTLYSRLLKDNDIDHPASIAFKINGFWVNGDFEPTNIKQIVQNLNAEHYFVKQTEDSNSGHGIKSFELPRERKDFIAYLEDLKANSVIQEGIVQHDTLALLHPHSVNTIRILTFLTKEGNVKVLSTILRMGRNKSCVDNACSGGLTVGIKSDGQLKPVGYDINGNRYEEHPDTHVAFKEIKLPNFPSITETIKRLAWKLPQTRLISWDIAVDQSGRPIIIEINLERGQLDFHQLNNGPIFGDYTEEVLKEVFDKG